MNQQQRILCVDDEPLNLELEEAILTPHGYEVLRAADGIEALALLGREPIDLVLLDVMMPGLDGYEVCRRLKADERLRHIPVVMITAYGARENRIQGIEAGAEEFLAKPFDSAEVLARVAMLLKVRNLNNRLVTAYHHINTLLAQGQQLTLRFDPLHYDVMQGISATIEQLINAAPRPEDRPEFTLLRLSAAGDRDRFWCFTRNNGTLLRHELPGKHCSILWEMAAGETMVWWNRAELKSEQGQRLSAALVGQGLPVPVNMACHLSEGITLCAVNYGREVTCHDAEVLNSAATQGIFFNSLATQVQETEDAFAYTVNALARAAEANDDDTGDHILRVGDYSAVLAERLQLPPEFVALIKLQGIMHDVGKIHVSPAVLKKPGRLDPEEFAAMSQHTTIGATIIGGHIRLTLAQEIALCHHERFDGSGYPRGIKGEEIPLSARILTIADQYDALRNKRCYKPPFAHDTTCRIISEGDGRTMPHHFDPAVLQAFRDTADRFAEIYAVNQPPAPETAAPKEEQRP